MIDSVAVPATAKRVIVTNVIDPFHLRIYYIADYDAKTVHLEKKLHHLNNTKRDKYRDVPPPQIGDQLLLDNSSTMNVELPAWCCRGVVGPRKVLYLKYGVFLPDHGIMLDFWPEELKIASPYSGSDDYLTSAVGISNILPITPVNTVAYISDHWSDVAVQFTREIINVAEQTYFDHITSDNDGNKYGELYLTLDGEIISLSRVLVYNKFATIISKDLIRIIGNPEDLVTFQLSSQPVKNICDDHGPTKKYSRHQTNKVDEYSNQYDTQDRDTNTVAYSRTFSGSLKTNRLGEGDHELLICSKIPCKHIESLKEADFPAPIHQVLSTFPLKRPMRLQGYVWPAVIQGFNVVVVGSRKTGKTMSYLLPIVGMVATNATHKKLPGFNGPLAIILCESSVDVCNIHEISTKLLKNYPNVRVLSAYNGIVELQVMIQIYNGCDILISTPAYLQRLIRNNKKQLVFNQLSHMVFDGVDVMFEKCHNSLGEILKVPRSVQSNHQQSPATSPLQMIATARHWTPSLRKFVNCLMEDPYVCNASYLEAAVYVGLKPKLIFLPKNQKAAKVIELLDMQWTMIKTLIVCTSTEEAMELFDVLNSNCIDTLVVHDKMNFTAILGARETWMTRVSGNYFVIICTDLVLSDLNIKDAEKLIHYSLSSSTKSQFIYRFSTLSDHSACRNRRKARTHLKKKLKPSCILLVDESNNAQLYSVVTMLRRLGVKIPSLMATYLEKIFKTAEMAKIDRLLCDNIKAFGHCPERDSCTSRHCIVLEVDQPATAIRTGDRVKLTLTGTHSPNHYSARVIEYTRADTVEVVAFSFQEFTHLTVKMQEHYRNPANRKLLKASRVGDICAIEETLGNYKRVKVLSTPGADSWGVQYVSVRGLDDGLIFSIKTCQLLELPEELTRWPTHILDIYLAGIVPLDKEPTWSPRAYEIVHTWFEKNLGNPESYIDGKVMLHLGHVLWVDPLEIRHKLHGYPDLADSSLKRTLINSNCAAENKQHIVDLLAHCEVGIRSTTNL